jgi:hypothetical protein
MERFQDDAVKVLVQTDSIVAGKTILQHGSGKEASETEVYVLIRLEDDNRRYYSSSVVSKAAFREITENKATFETLTTNFNGRSKGDMITFLAKNYIAPKVVAEQPETEAA